MGKATKATLVFLVLFIGGVVWLSTRVAQYECRVCLTYNGHTECRTAASGTKDAAIQSAVTADCGTLAGGMTETIACQNTRPDSVDCRGK